MESTLQHPFRASAIGVRWLKIAVVYFIIGVSLGIAMGATQNFTLRPVHAHLNLLGWATLALAGIIYTLFPKAGESRLGIAHFWLHNLSLPIMMVSLALLLFGHSEAIPALQVGEMMAFAAVLLFAVNVFTNVKRT
jgi:hypothetical protein